MSLHDELFERYETINQKYSLPIPQLDFNNDENHCVCLWANVKENQNTLCLPSRPSFLTSNDAYYTSNGGGDGGTLHFTLFQFQTFGTSVPRSSVQSKQYIISGILKKYPQLQITFKGLMKVKHGIAICGYPSFDINKIRQNFREKIVDITEPHPQDICHMTLLRFGESIKMKIDDIDDFIAKYKNHTFGEMVVSKWNYGYGTWMQNNCEIVCNIYSPLWILHRGLMKGPNVEIENNISDIKIRVNEGWSVEVDLWRIDGEIKIGHDELRSISPEDVTWLLKQRSIFIHCKNIEMLEYINEINITVNKTNGEVVCDYFFHDRDDATLTRKGRVWCYPGNSCKGCIIVLPEKKVDMMNKAISGKDIYGVCSDYTQSSLKQMLTMM